MKKRKTVESTLILEALQSEILMALVKIALSNEFDFLQEFLRKYIETKRNQILDLPTENERKLANELSFRKGNIYTVQVIIDVMRGAQEELNKREEKLKVEKKG